MPQSFDALEFANELIENGFTEQQAHALAHGIWKLSDTQLASKLDLLALEQRLGLRIEAGDERLEQLIKAGDERLDQRITELEQRLRLEIREGLASLRSELLKIILGAVVIQSGIVAALFKWLH